MLANDTDVDGGPMTIDSVTQPANGTVVITGGGTGLTYEPDPNYCNDPPAARHLHLHAQRRLHGDGLRDGHLRRRRAGRGRRHGDGGRGRLAATAVDVLANDTDVDGGPMSVASVTQPANGTVAITGGGTGLTYEPDADYCNSQPGGSPDTFTYTLNGGDTATVSVTVTCVDDAPVAVNDSRRWPRTPAPTAIDVLANDTDVDGGPKSVASVTQPANGTVVITGGGTGLTYEPDAELLQHQPGGSPDDVHLHAQRRRQRDGLGDGDLRRRRAGRGQRLRDGGRGRRRPPRSTCWRTTPTSTAAR